MNYYEILGVTTDSDATEIKAAYRKLVRQFHPDVNPSGARKFKDISKAYDTLIDDEKRKQYDILNGLFKSSANFEEELSKTAKSNDGNTSKEKKLKQDENIKPKRKQQDFSGMFNNIFDGKSNEKDKLPIDGEDINTDISITLLESFKGTSKTVNIMHTELCPRCKGRKFINGSKCNVCNGTGEYIQHKRINVAIPKNIKNNSKLRLKGEGGVGKYGGKNGDLYITIKIEENPNIKYEGNDIIYNVPITPYEAVLGEEIILPAPHGNIKLKLPPHTVTGQKFRISGQGAIKNGKTGDIIVVVSIEIPKTLSDDEVKLYEKLKKISANNLRDNILNDKN